MRNSFSKLLNLAFRIFNFIMFCLGIPVLAAFMFVDLQTGPAWLFLMTCLSVITGFLQWEALKPHPDDLSDTV